MDFGRDETTEAYAELCKQSIKRLPSRNRSNIELQSFAGFAEVNLPSSQRRSTFFVSRLFSGITNQNGPQPIVDAWIESEQLVRLSASFERMTVPLEKLSKVLGTKKGDIEAFEIDEDGRFLFLPHAHAIIARWCNERGGCDAR